MMGGGGLAGRGQTAYPCGDGGNRGEKFISSRGHPACDRSRSTSLRIFIIEPLLCFRRSQHKVIQNISWNRFLVKLGIFSGEHMKGIQQGPRAAVPERLWSDLIAGADSWGHRPPFTRMAPGCVASRPLTSQLWWASRGRGLSLAGVFEEPPGS